MPVTGLFFWTESGPSPGKIEAMRYLNWIDQLSPVAALSSIAFLFLIASILGWYVGSLIQWLRR